MARAKSFETNRGKRRQEEKYQRILDAALEVFSEKGFYEAKVNDIARVAGVADGTIYLYFKNKDDLVASLVDTLFEFINERIKLALYGITDARDRVHRLIRFHIGLAYEDPTLMRFLTVELRRGGPGLKEKTRSKVIEYVGLWEKTIEDGKTQGHFRPELRAGIIKHLIFGALDYMSMSLVAKPEPPAERIEAIMNESTDFVLRAVVLGTEAPTWSQPKQLVAFEA
ncbi:MAG: TetR/AcrR family transcriptional regulator [Clostridia bacterium]|nr:TetR/AcrR family transcriptional regulator [Deltaproteobacteria bacterium]